MKNIYEKPDCMLLQISPYEILCTSTEGLPAGSADNFIVDSDNDVEF